VRFYRSTAEESPEHKSFGSFHGIDSPTVWDGSFRSIEKALVVAYTIIIVDRRTEVKESAFKPVLFP